MVNDSYFRFDDDNKIKYTFSRSSQENWVSWRHTAPYSEYKDNWENCLNLRHTLGIIYLTSILVVQCFQISLHNDDNSLSEAQCRCVKIIFMVIIYGSITSYENRIMYAISWRTIHGFTGGLFWCLLPFFVCNAGNKQQNNTASMRKHFPTPAHT